MSKRPHLLSALLLSAIATAATADDVAVEAVSVKRMDSGRYRFDVTLRHADTGWDHYADRWEILTTGGDLLATRKLLHPHVDEQPFTRGLSGVKIPAGVMQVIVRGHDSVHGYSTKTKRVVLPLGDK